MDKIFVFFGLILAGLFLFGCTQNYGGSGSFPLLNAIESPAQPYADVATIESNAESAVAQGKDLANVNSEMEVGDLDPQFALG